MEIIPYLLSRGTLFEIFTLYSLLQLIGVPYIAAKLSSRFENTPELSLATRSVSGLALAFKIAYMLRLSRFYSPLFFIFGIRIDRQSPSDIQSHDKAMEASRKILMSRLSFRNAFSNPRDFVSSILSFASGNIGLLKTGLPAILFLYKFSTWFMENHSDKIKGDVPIPPPPPVRNRHPRSMVRELEQGKCPICCREFVNPTAIPSGYVYCYRYDMLFLINQRCIFDHVEEHATCPVSLCSVERSELRRVFVS